MEIKVAVNTKQLNDAFYVRRSVFVDEQQVPEEEEIDQYENESIHVVLYDNDQSVGAGRFRNVDGICKVERICVVKSHRKSGAGKLIMTKIEELAREQGFHKLKLNAQTHAESFYQKLGYHTVSDEIFLDAGIPHVTMMKEIDVNSVS